MYPDMYVGTVIVVVPVGPGHATAVPIATSVLPPATMVLPNIRVVGVAPNAETTTLEPAAPVVGTVDIMLAEEYIVRVVVTGVIPSVTVTVYAPADGAVAAVVDIYVWFRIPAVVVKRLTPTLLESVTPVQELIHVVKVGLGDAVMVR